MTNEEWAEWKLAEGRIHAVSDWYYRLTPAQGLAVRARLLDLESALLNIAESAHNPDTAQLASCILAGCPIGGRRRKGRSANATMQTLAPEAVEYPEHMKLRAISDESQAIYNFLEWCEEQGVVLAERLGENENLFRTGRSIRDLLAAHFEIDQDKIEAEKCAMLESIRARG